MVVFRQNLTHLVVKWSPTPPPPPPPPLYTKKMQDRDAVSKFIDSGEKMWRLLSKNQHDTLSRTPDVLKFHVQRSNYYWALEGMLYILQIPRPSDHGWKDKDGRLVATMTDQRNTL